MNLFNVDSKSSIILSYEFSPVLVGSTNAADFDEITSGLGSAPQEFTWSKDVFTIDGEDTCGPARAYFLKASRTSAHNLAQTVWEGDTVQTCSDYNDDNKLV